MHRTRAVESCYVDDCFLDVNNNIILASEIIGLCYKILHLCLLKNIHYRVQKWQFLMIGHHTVTL